MPIYDFRCGKCKKKFEEIVKMDKDFVTCECGYIAKRIFPQKSPSFKLKYNPKTDIVDWDGNTTRYYDEYKNKKVKARK